jgi:hypothetical protein
VLLLHGVDARGMILSLSVLQALFVDNNHYASFIRLKGARSRPSASFSTPVTCDCDIIAAQSREPIFCKSCAIFQPISLETVLFWVAEAKPLRYLMRQSHVIERSENSIR